MPVTTYSQYKLSKLEPQDDIFPAHSSWIYLDQYFYEIDIFMIKENITLDFLLAQFRIFIYPKTRKYYMPYTRGLYSETMKTKSKHTLSSNPNSLSAAGILIKLNAADLNSRPEQTSIFRKKESE